MPPDFQQQTPTRKLFHLLSRYSSWGQDEIENSFYQSDIYPDRKAWIVFLKRLSLSAGVVMTLCGIIFFFAFNWAGMHKFLKLGLLQSILLGSGIYTWYQARESFSFKMGLTATAVMVGATLAVYGQIYQTGANAYDFFWGWTILVVAWGIISRFPPLWFIVLLLANVTLIMYQAQVLRVSEEPIYWLWNVGLNIGALAIFEYLQQQQGVEYPSRWLPRLTGLYVIFLLTFLSIWIIFDRMEASHDLLVILVGVAISGVGIWLYTSRIKDLFFPALIAISIMIIAVSFIFRNLVDNDWVIAFFSSSLVAILFTTLTVRWLISLNRKWNQPPNSEVHGKS